MISTPNLQRLTSLGFRLALAASLAAVSAGCEKAGSRAVEWPDVSGELQQQADGAKDVAVIVGLERYQELASIPGAEENSFDWYRYLTRSRGVPRGRVRHLMNNDAKSYKIKEAVKELAAQAQPGGRFWFVFIGHGAPNEQQEPLLVGFDAEASVSGLEERSLRQSDVLDWMKQSEATPVALFDACFSGSAKPGEALVPGLQPSAVVESAEAPLGGVVLTAARSNEFAGPLPGGNRPAFSYLALAGLRGWADDNRDGSVTAQEVRDYVDETLRDFLRGERSQTPTITGRADMSLGAGGEAAPDLEPLVAQFRGQPPPAEHPRSEPAAAASPAQVEPTAPAPPPPAETHASAPAAAAATGASDAEALAAANQQIDELRRTLERYRQILENTDAQVRESVKTCRGVDVPADQPACGSPAVFSEASGGAAHPQPQTELEYRLQVVAELKQALLSYGMAIDNCSQTLAQVQSSCGG